MVGSFCIASRCLLRRCTCIDRPIGPTSGVASSRPSVARTLPRDRPTDPLLPAAAAALFVPFLRSVRCCTPSSLWECTYDVHINFGYSHPPYSSLSMSLIRLFYSFCPFLGLRCGHPLCMCACSPVALFLFHSLPRSSAKCSCMLHYCSSVSRPPAATAAMMLDMGELER